MRAALTLHACGYDDDLVVLRGGNLCARVFIQSVSICERNTLLSLSLSTLGWSLFSLCVSLRFRPERHILTKYGGPENAEWPHKRFMFCVAQVIGRIRGIDLCTSVISFILCAMRLVSCSDAGAGRTFTGGNRYDRNVLWMLRWRRRVDSCNYIADLMRLKQTKIYTNSLTTTPLTRPRVGVGGLIKSQRARIKPSANKTFQDSRCVYDIYDIFVCEMCSNSCVVLWVHACYIARRARVESCRLRQLCVCVFGDVRGLVLVLALRIYGPVWCSSLSQAGAPARRNELTSQAKHAARV